MGSMARQIPPMTLRIGNDEDGESMAQMNTRSRRAAFTLVELLVVIAIIAVLAALLMPSLSSARERGRRAACLMNQRQIYVATVAYTSDNNNYLPPGSDPACGMVSLAANGWGNCGKFWQNYVGVKSLNGTTFNQPNNVLLCPSGLRRTWNLTTWPNCGWPVATDYALIGCAPTSWNYGNVIFPAKANLWWEAYRTGPRVFSMDIAHSAPDNFPNGMYFSPHLANDGIAAGLNVLATDGSGEWQTRTNCTLYGGNRAGGIWQYYMNYMSMVIPIKYQVLYTEGNTTYCYGAGGSVHTTLNGHEGTAIGPPFTLAGLEVWCPTAKGMANPAGGNCTGYVTLCP